jgi:hypothetical protein
MDAVYRIKASEFDDFFINQIKELLKRKNNLEITIAISEEPSRGILRKETREEYFARLDKAIENIDNAKGVAFTDEGIVEFSKQLLNEP